MAFWSACCRFVHSAYYSVGVLRLFVHVTGCRQCAHGHRDHAKPYRLPFTNSCSKVVCLWLICVAGVLGGEVTAPPWRRVLVRHLNTIAQNIWGVCHKWCSSACKGWGGDCWVKSVIITAWACAVKRMRGSRACGSACLTMHTLTHQCCHHTLLNGTQLAFSSLWPGPSISHFHKHYEPSGWFCSVELLLLFQLVRIWLWIVGWAMVWGEGLPAPCVPVSHRWSLSPPPGFGFDQSCFVIGPFCYCMTRPRKD